MPSRLLLRWGFGVVALVFSASLFVEARQPSFSEIETKIRELRREFKNNLFDGKTAADPKNPKHVMMLDLQAQWLVWRFVDAPFQPGGEKDTKFNAQIGDVDRDIKSLTGKREDTVEASRIFTNSYVTHARATLASPKRTAVNALNLMRATVLVAKLGQGELADLLLDVLQDEMAKDKSTEAEVRANAAKAPNDGLKYYALKALQELLSQEPLPPLKEPILNKEREEKVCKALTAYINTNVTYKDGTPPQLIDGRRVLRREAIKALGLVGHPTLPDKKNGAAVTLLRVLTRSGMSPEPGIEERMEAAIGLARMRLNADPDYNADYALSQVALFLDDFISFCNKAGPDGNTELQRPVRIYAAHLDDALAAIKKQLDDPVIGLKFPAPQRDYLNKAIPAIQIELRGIEKEGRRDGNALPRFRDANKPASDMLIKGVPESKMTPKKAEAMP
jgi:hypothetical protein